ncbi:glycosyl hydrolase family 28 protein [Actinoplanes sp. NPDC026619]|uniref:glycoside hydrolase family 28 protein n=1 Tax=Actinoplanes sp. NPDC026619 TaxID=3155798 RepID=UPI0033FCA4D0
MSKRSRRLAVWAAVVCTMAGLAPGTARAAAAGSGDFNDVAVGELPGGWSVSAGSGGTAAVVPVPDATNRSLQVSGGATATTTLAGLTGTVRAEMRVRGAGALTLAGDAGPAAGVVLRDGRLTDAATGALLTAVTADRWYALRAELDVTAQQWDLYVDGLRLLTGARFATASTALTALSVGDAGTFGIDDVLVREIPAPSVAYLVEDGFNDAPAGATPPGWFQASAGATVVATPSDADRSLRLTKSASAAAVSAIRRFPAQSGVLLVRANLRTDELTGTKVAMYLQNDSGAAAVSLQFVKDHLVLTDGKTSTQLLTLTAGEWYAVQLAVDVATHQFEIFVDGRRYAPAATAGSTVVPQWPLRDQTMTSISRLLFGVGDGQAGTVLVDNLLVYPSGSAIPAEVRDVRQFGAVPDGVTLNTVAIQRAIDDTPVGGAVLVSGGVFRTGTLRLKSDLTLWVARGATLLGSPDDNDYPLQDRGKLDFPDFGSSTWKALIYSVGAGNVHIDGGGTIDGNGTSAQWVGCDGTACPTVRPLLIAPMAGSNVSIRNVHVRNSAAWGIVPVQIDGLLIADVNLDSDIAYNRDGIDVVDSHHVLIERVSVLADDDAICFKSNTAAGVEHAVVRLSTVGRSSRANGLKLGTASFGAFRDGAMEDVLVKHVDKSAITVLATDGGVAWMPAFRRITIDGARRSHFVLLGRRTADRTNPPPPAWISGVRLEDITATHLVEPSIVTGQDTFRVYDVLVSNVRTAVPGGAAKVPAEPIEYDGRYPESSLWSATTYGVLPVYGHFFRHVGGLTVRATVVSPAAADARPETGLRDVS